MHTVLITVKAFHNGADLDTIMHTLLVKHCFNIPNVSTLYFIFENTTYCNEAIVINKAIIKS